VSSLWEAARVLSATSPAPAVRPARSEAPPPADADDLADVRGQSIGRRALEIAAAGGHHLLLGGPPGAGKTMLARRLPGLLPPLDFDEALTVTTIHSIAGLLPPGGSLITTRPFRAPHHTCSDVALIGGGSLPRPGELSLAHAGVLFLDELPEFRRHVLETLRQPLESGTIQVARAHRTVTFPSRVTLVAAMNPCPCGFRGDSHRQCRCTPAALERYQSRISGPMRDRFDMSVDVAAVPWRDLRGEASGESTSTVRQRVLGARRRQAARQGRLNGQLDGRALRDVCRMGDTVEALLERAMTHHDLSARGLSRVLRVARTIADLAGAVALEAGHVAEALQYRLPGTRA